MIGRDPEPHIIEDIRAELTMTVPRLHKHGSPWTSVEDALAWWIRLYRLTTTSTSMPMQCGRCGRRLCHAYACAPNGLPQAVPVGDNHIMQPRHATGQGRAIRDARMPDKLLQERWEVSCHRKCGARYLLTGGALLKAFVVTGEQGRNVIIVGSGRYAATRGGADI